MKSLPHTPFACVVALFDLYHGTGVVEANLNGRGGGLKFDTTMIFVTGLRIQGQLGTVVSSPDPDSKQL